MKREERTPPKALLIDLDGTLYFRGEPYPGAVEAVKRLRQKGYRFRFLTNTTAKTPKTLHAHMRQMGFEVDEREIFNATYACLCYLRSKPQARCHFMVDDSVKPYFKEIPKDDAAPDYIVIGDYGEGFSFRALNHAFRLLRDGAELIALQKGMYWFAPDGVYLDCGAFVTLLEAASGKTAEVIGKPSKMFFNLALESLQMDARSAVVVGDDLLTDIAGAAGMGMRSVLVKTGKFKKSQLKNAPAEPTWTVESVLQLPELF